MLTPLIYLFLETVLFWSLIVFFYRQKLRFTLIPLYCYIALLTLLTHNFSDLGFAVVINGWYFLIASFSFFTTLMLGVLFLYLLEGPRAARLALLIILFSSFLYILVVFVLNQQVDTSRWVTLTSTSLKYYFWSIFAIIVDVFYITILWELLAKVRHVPIYVRIFLVTVSTYFVDSLIFVTGVFGQLPLYFDILQGNLTVRLILACTITPIIHYHLQRQGYSEETRSKPKNFWEILNFRSDLELRLQTVETNLKQESTLKHLLEASQETYSLALQGANAGIWDWDILKDQIMWSSKFLSLLGYRSGELGAKLDDFKKIVHPDDLAPTMTTLNQSFKAKQPFAIDYRLKSSDGVYRWYSCGGITKFDKFGKPIRMVGSITDVDDKKQLAQSLEDKVIELEQLNDQNKQLIKVSTERVAELERLNQENQRLIKLSEDRVSETNKMNKVMVGRELEMIKLKKKITRLEK